MSSLAELPEIIGFFSYSREDDEDFSAQLSSLRDAIQKELRAALGRTRRDFHLWQDQQAIAPGEQWESKIASAISEATFFIPIVTPRAVNSKHCRFEFEAFLAREQALGRNNLVFPIHYINVPALTDESKRRSDPVLSIVGARQFVDWRNHRQWPSDSPACRKAIIDLCASITAALQQTWISPEERRHQEEVALQREEEKRQHQESENKKRAEEEGQRQEAEKRKRAQESASLQEAEATKGEQEKSRRTNEVEDPNAVAETGEPEKKKAVKKPARQSTARQSTTRQLSTKESFTEKLGVSTLIGAIVALVVGIVSVWIGAHFLNIITIASFVVIALTVFKEY